MELVSIRLKETKDDPFIYNSWLKSNRAKHANMPTSDYFAHYKKLINNLLYKSLTFIACDPKDPEFIYGYIVIRPIEDLKIIHYVYVKKPFRRFGVLKQLLKSQEINLADPILITTKPPEYFKKYTLVYRPDLKEL